MRKLVIASRVVSVAWLLAGCGGVGSVEVFLDATAQDTAGLGGDARDAAIAETTVVTERDDATGTDADPDADVGPEHLAAGIYTQADDPLRIIVPAGVLPADWTPTVGRQAPLDLDLTASAGVRVTTGAIYDFAATGVLAAPVWLEVPAPEVPPSGVLVALVWEPAVSDWVFVPHDVVPDPQHPNDVTKTKLLIRAQHFSTYTSAVIDFTTLDAVERLGPQLGVQPDPTGVTATSLRPLTVPPEEPALSLYAATAQATTLAAANATAAQQAMNNLSAAATAQGVAALYGLDAGAVAPVALATGPATAIASGASGVAYLGPEYSPNYSDPCAHAACGGGALCTPSGTFASCTCPQGTSAAGLSCGIRNEPPSVAVEGGSVVLGGTLALHATVSDPEGAPVALTWSIGGQQNGSVAPATGSDVVFTPPDHVGFVLGQVRAVDRDGAARVVSFGISVVRPE